MFSSIGILHSIQSRMETTFLTRHIILALWNGNLPVTGEFPAPVTRTFDVFLDLCLNKRLSKQSRGWWFDTSSPSLWRHRNVTCIVLYSGLRCRQISTITSRINSIWIAFRAVYWDQRQKNLKAQLTDPMREKDLTCVFPLQITNNAPTCFM